MIVYITKNLINGKKYIGKDIKNNPKYLGSGSLLKEDIKKYGKDNFEKVILELCKNEEELRIREIYWIKFFNAVENDEFYNLVYISGGWNFKSLSKDKYDYVCDKISKKMTGILRPNLHNDEERKQKLRKANKGVKKPKGFGRKGIPKPKGFGEKISRIKLAQHTKFTDEHRKKISDKKLGCKYPNRKGKPIIQKDLNGNIIKEWITIKEASETLKLKRSNISCCLTGYTKTAFGFIWVYM